MRPLHQHWMYECLQIYNYITTKYKYSLLSETIIFSELARNWMTASLQLFCWLYHCHCIDRYLVIPENQVMAKSPQIHSTFCSKPFKYSEWGVFMAMKADYRHDWKNKKRKTLINYREKRKKISLSLSCHMSRCFYLKVMWVFVISGDKKKITSFIFF